MSIVLPDATTVSMGPFAPKATSIAGGQQEAALEVWASADKKVDTGIWECTPGTFTATREGFHEVCQILSGRATITHEDGTVVEVGPGSTLITPEGWRGQWQIHETLRKTYVIITL